MLRLVVKTSVVTIVSFVLLYYGVAWAVLRCAHQEVQSDQEVALHNLRSHGGVNSINPPSVPQEDLDCTGADYHVESLVRPATSSELLRLLRDTAPHHKATLPALSNARAPAPDLLIEALFNRVSCLPSPTDLRRFLSLSVLRL